MAERLLRSFGCASTQCTASGEWRIGRYFSFGRISSCVSDAFSDCRIRTSTQTDLASADFRSRFAIFHFSSADIRESRADTKRLPIVWCWRCSPSPAHGTRVFTHAFWNNAFSSGSFNLFCVFITVIVQMRLTMQTCRIYGLLALRAIWWMPVKFCYFPASHWLPMSLSKCLPKEIFTYLSKIGAKRRGTNWWKMCNVRIFRCLNVHCMCDSKETFQRTR